MKNNKKHHTALLSTNRMFSYGVAEASLTNNCGHPSHLCFLADYHKDIAGVKSL